MIKSKFNLSEIEVAIKDIKYLKALKATTHEIEITKKVLKLLIFCLTSF